jgi:demethylspheroidene O-methyltransferase
VARIAQLPVANAEMLLRAAAALRLLRPRQDGTYGLGLLGAALIENPGVVAMVEHNALLYRDLADPAAFLRKARPDGELAAFWAYADDGRGVREQAAQATQYSLLMAASQAMVSEQVLDAFPLGDVRQLLDVGGGHGAFARAVTERWPGVSVCIFDLPTVGDAPQAPSAQIRISRHPGDFRTEPLPSGADAISLVRVLHDHDDATVSQLLSKAADALPEGGRILIAEPMRGAGAEARMADAYFGFYLRGMGRGRIRSADEIESLLRRAGFVQVHRKSTKLPLVASVVVGKCAKQRQKKLTQLNVRLS